MDGSGRGGEFLLSVADNNLSILWQTEVSTIVVDAAHPSLTGVW